MPIPPPPAPAPILYPYTPTSIPARPPTVIPFIGMLIPNPPAGPGCAPGRRPPRVSEVPSIAAGPDGRLLVVVGLLLPLLPAAPFACTELVLVGAGPAAREVLDPVDAVLEDGGEGFGLPPPPPPLALVPPGPPEVLGFGPIAPAGRGVPPARGVPRLAACEGGRWGCDCGRYMPPMTTSFEGPPGDVC